MAKKKEAQIWLGTEASFAEYQENMIRMENADPEMVKAMEAKMFPDEEAREVESPIMNITDGVAIIDVKGSLTNDSGWWSLMFGMTPYSYIYDAAIEAALDDRVESILLSVDSNGGTVAGISDALEGLREAAEIKPIYTHTASNMNSAAYWIGSIGQNVMADRMAEVGSIGVIAIMMEYTQALKEDGVTPHVFRAGEFKALGNPYEEMSDVAAKTIQDRLDARYGQFLEDVATNRGRTKENVKATMAEGQVFLASDAMSVGLIDKVMSFNDAFRFVKADSQMSDTDRLRGNQGFGAQASDAELPIQSQEGEDMSKKKVMTKAARAAIAEGVELDAALDALGSEVDESAEDATGEETVENNEVEPTAESENSESAEEENAEAEVENTAEAESADVGVLALVAQVGTLSESLAEAKVEAKTLKAQADLAEAQMDSFKTIASDSITRMSIAMGATVQDLSTMSAENLLALHGTTRTSFNKSLPVGQHVDTSASAATVNKAVDELNQRLAGLTTK